MILTTTQTHGGRNTLCHAARRALGCLPCVAALIIMLTAPATAAAKAHDQDADRLANFFVSALRGDSACGRLLPQRHFRAGDAAAMRTLVWHSWQKALAQADGNALAPLRPLADSVSASWLLPQALEPHAVMNYWWGSKGSRPDSGYPLYLYLHGSGPRNMEWQYGRLWALRFDDAPSAYFIPQIPNEGAWYRWWQRSKQWAWERLLRHALADGAIDPWRVYILGISEGGYGSQRLAAFYADYLSGAGPMAGGEPLKNAPAENCAHVAFSFLTGADDAMFYRNRLTGYTLQAFDSLQKQTASDTLFRHRIELIPGRGHHIDYTLTTPWLKQYRRRPWPKTLMWEDYAMDSRHRAGFYNIKVENMPAALGDTTPASDRRVRYDMTISDNVVRLDVRQVYYTTTERDPQWGIELRFSRSYKPAATGRVRLFLDEHLLDMRRPVTVIANGQEVFRGRLKPSLAAMADACATFFDPLRLYSASVVVDLKGGK